MTTDTAGLSVADLAALDPRIGQLLSEAYRAGRDRGRDFREARRSIRERAAVIVGPRRWPKHPVLSTEAALGVVQHVLVDQMRG